MDSARGRLVVFEGGEGCGKTTQLQLLLDLLKAAGVPACLFREPGGTELGQEVRRLLLDRASDIVPSAEALLFMASRGQLVAREIRPALSEGRLVLLDRFFLSTYAYQVHGHGLEEADIRAANHLATGGLRPDLTLLLALPPELGLERAAARAAEHDRMEAMGSGFHERVARAFESFSDAAWQQEHDECGPIARIDAGGSVAEVSLRVRAALLARWPGLLPEAEK